MDAYKEVRKSIEDTKICVTGCAGYIGSKLTLNLLSMGYKVYGIDNLFHKNYHSVCNLISQYPNKFLFRRGDIMEKTDWYRKFDVVIHLAALVGQPLCKKYSKEAERINREGTKHICNHIRKDAKLIYCCSNSGYGHSSKDKLLSEDDPFEPISLYAKTKAEGEEYVRETKYGVSLRLSTVYGASPRMRFDLLMNDFFYQIYFNKKIELYEPHFVRNFIYINDVIFAIMQLVDRKYEYYNLFNLGDETLNRSKEEIAAMIFDYLMIDRNIIIREGKDPDQRNYAISSKRAKSCFLLKETSPYQGFQELHNLVRSLKQEEILGMRNDSS